MRRCSSTVPGRGADVLIGLLLRTVHTPLRRFDRHHIERSDLTPAPRSPTIVVVRLALAKQCRVGLGTQRLAAAP